jgi:hypothetical protein
MGFQQAFNVPTEAPPSPADEYATELAIFVDGTWRLLA